uniref:Uncharacterized protein n=1 Tax=Salix viminalis TaxID=40686 RepID=A0A6N2K6U6_SALVM
MEDGLSYTILTIPLLQQQAILLIWFDRFLSGGTMAPIYRKQSGLVEELLSDNMLAEPDNSHLQITVCDHPN